MLQREHERQSPAESQPVASPETIPKEFVMNTKNATRFLALAAALLFSVVGLGATGAGELMTDMVRGSGNPTTATYALSGFSRIHLDRIAEYEIVQSDSFRVELTADSNIIENVTVSQKFSRLTVSVPPTFESKSVKARIWLPALREAMISGGSKGKLEGIQASELEVSVTGRSWAEGRVEAESFTLMLDDASQANFDGWAENLRVEASDESSALLSNFEALKAVVKLGVAYDAEEDENVHSNAYAEIYVNGEANVSLYRDSELYYKGNITFDGISAGEDVTFERAVN
jgi:hypothetical protein